MLDNLFGIGWMINFEWCLWVYQIDRKMCSNGLKGFVICPFMVSVGFVDLFVWPVLVVLIVSLLVWN